MNTNLVDYYQKKVDDLIADFNEKPRQSKSCNLVDRSHFCKNGNMSPCYICGNCGNTLLFPGRDMSKLVLFDYIHCTICRTKNSTFKIDRRWTYEGIGEVGVKRIPQGRYFIVVPDIENIPIGEK